MRFYTRQHAFYCRIDLHARRMYVCILSQKDESVYHENLPGGPEAFLQAVAAYRGDLVVGVECVFTWYWLADLSRKEGIEFVLGHSLYMKAIHGAKVKNDRVDSQKIAGLLRGGCRACALASMGNEVGTSRRCATRSRRKTDAERSFRP